jgi:DNA-directed RNA polymerase specialized sigma24 family protein
MLPEEIAATLGLSVVRVEAIIRSAITKIRLSMSPAEAASLRQYLDA